MESFETRRSLCQETVRYMGLSHLPACSNSRNPAGKLYKPFGSQKLGALLCDEALEYSPVDALEEGQYFLLQTLGCVELL